MMLNVCMCVLCQVGLVRFSEGAGHGEIVSVTSKTRAKPCTTVVWNPNEPSQLAVGWDKVKGHEIAGVWHRLSFYVHTYCCFIYSCIVFFFSIMLMSEIFVFPLKKT